MFGIFKRAKKLEQENRELKAIINSYEMPLKLDLGVTQGEWSELSEKEQVMRMRKLDLVLTMKKTRRWDYSNNCAKLD
ncbi:hypothetical protein ACFVYJ_01330 [Pontibacter sp. JAM-7]|uniref:hypothetical protein n=1 Tax=Pontibacter sp. JAM-7 TaxID=3366581 RepID=UPI003AF5496A